MKSGIIGARGVGKSTVFHALTGLAPIAGQGDLKNRARPGQIRVSEPRLDFLESTYGSKKKVPVELTVLVQPTLTPLVVTQAEAKSSAGAASPSTTGARRVEARAMVGTP